MKKEIKKEEDDQTDQLDFQDKRGHSVTLQSNWNWKAKMVIELFGCLLQITIPIHKL